LSDKSTTNQPSDGRMPDSLVGSGAVFERSKGIHLLPTVSAAPNELPPSAAITPRPAPQASAAPEASAPAAPPEQSPPDSGD
jgi:hypothetical protein